MSRSAKALIGAGLAVAMMPSAALARAADEPAAGRTPNAEDVAMTPLTDLNIRKDAVPAALLAALADPYASSDIRKCADVAAALAPLEAALGPDMDVAGRQSERLSAGVVAKSVVASFIPFRGILREVSGAAEHERTFESAIYAGAVRRGFLKGLGQQMKCPYPTRPAFTRVAVADVPAIDARPAKRPKRGKRAATASSAVANGFVSQPVIQPIERVASER